MHSRSLHKVAKKGLTLALTSALLASLQACSPISSSPSASVIDAYHTADAIAVQPYTRTIFSSNNF